MSSDYSTAKDSWLVNGLFDYYLSTDSLRAIEVLSGVREPHDKHLLDRLAETFGKTSGHGQRVQALKLLGHVARRQPTWLYKLANHALFKELLKLLKAMIKYKIIYLKKFQIVIRIRSKMNYQLLS